MNRTIAILFALASIAHAGTRLAWEHAGPADTFRLFRDGTQILSIDGEVREADVELAFGPCVLTIRAEKDGVMSPDSNTLAITVPTPPTNFRIIIQSAENAGGPWTDTPHALAMTASDWQRFYRLRIEQ